MYSQLTSSIKSAYDKCCRVVSVNGLKKNKTWYTKELNCLKYEMLSIGISYILHQRIWLSSKDLKKALKIL